jgi:hypothetical protein
MSTNLNAEVWNRQAPNSFLRNKYATADEYVTEMKRRRNNPNWAMNNARGRREELEGVARAHASVPSRRLIGGRKSTRKYRKTRRVRK